MKLIRFGKVESEKPGVQLDNGQKIDVSAFGSDYDEKFFGSEGPRQRMGTMVMRGIQQNSNFDFCKMIAEKKVKLRKMKSEIRKKVEV